MKKKTEHIRHKDVEAFGKSLGLSKIDMELIRYKRMLVTKLKERRLKMKMSQASLAQKLGTLQPAIARMEAGQIGQVSLDFLVKAAMILGVSVTIRGTMKAA